MQIPKLPPFLFDLSVKWKQGFLQVLTGILFAFAFVVNVSKWKVTSYSAAEKAVNSHSFCAGAETENISKKRERN